MDRAEFNFDFGRSACTIYRALLPETEEPFPKSRVSLSVDGEILHLSADADDTAALRAALNTWLRLVKVACEMSEIRAVNEAGEDGFDESDVLSLST